MTTIPLKDRPVDYIYLAFFFVNLFFITYIVDLEQLVIPDPAQYQQPAWPPPVMLKIIHSYGSTYDPLLMARPQWWKNTIWLDVIVFGPYYAAAIYAFIKGKNWIRIPTLVIMPILFTNVFIICSEEIFGPIGAINLPLVLLANLPWALFPVFLVWKMWRNEKPFTIDN